jgi:hypothetical protein
MTRALTIYLSLWLLAGCSLLGLGALRVESVALSVQKPSNIAVYLSAANGDEPLTDLTESAFRVYENERLLDPNEIGLTLLERSVAAEHHALLLVDMGHQSEDVRQSIAQAVPAFVQQVRRSQGVTVYAFDGSTKLTLVGEFSRGESGPESGSLAQLATYRPSDISRNLHGAVLEGLEQLDARLMRVQKPVRVGALIVFARGPDLAGRVSAEQVRDALYETKHYLFTLGVGESEGEILPSFGRGAKVQTPSLDTLAIGFEQLASKVDAAVMQHYLLAYCSPSRSGQRRLRVEAAIVDPDGHELTGSAELEFDATGFGGGCDPHAVPRFVSQSPAPGQGPAAAGAQDISVRAPPAAGSTADAPSDAGGAEGEALEVAPPPDRPGYAPQ